MWKKCTPLWREAHFEIKCAKKTEGFGTLLDVRMSFCKSERNVKFCSSFNYNHHYTKLHYTPLQLQLQPQPQLHYTTLHTTLHYTTLHYTTAPHYTTLTTTTATATTTTTLLYTTLHYTTLEYTTLHYITLHHLIVIIFPQGRFIPLHPLQMQLPLHYTNYTIPQLQLHHTTTTAELHHTTSSSCGWGDRPGDHCNHCNHSKEHNSSYLWVHQWIRSAIRDSQQPLL